MRIKNYFENRNRIKLGAVVHNRFTEIKNNNIFLFNVLQSTHLQIVDIGTALIHYFSVLTVDIKITLISSSQYLHFNVVMNDRRNEL